jgi:Uma2 family endonuclease
MTAAFLEPVAAPILISDLTWREFKAVEQLLNRPGVRLSFLAGVLEIRNVPGKQHETVKKRIAALVETYLEIKGFDFTPTGSVTLENEEEQVKHEADESYELAPGRNLPDLAIEVMVSSGGINKLEAYKRLQIPELWFWEKGRLSLYALSVEGYEAIERSQLLPELDIELLTDCINLPNHAQAVKTFRQAISE